MTKPAGCSTCQFARSSTGFCPDWVPARPKLAVVLKMPGKDEVNSLNPQPAIGTMGRFFFRTFFTRVGIKREDVLIENVIRCYPNAHEFPVGAMRKRAVETCRQWDRLVQWQPTIYIVSFNPAMLLRAPQQSVFLHRAVEKAAGFARAGERPCLLLGEEAREKYAPWLHGAMKRWQGHFYYAKD